MFVGSSTTHRNERSRRGSEQRTQGSASVRELIFPFLEADKGVNVEIYHGAHGRYEDTATVRRGGGPLAEGIDAARSKGEREPSSLGLDDLLGRRSQEDPGTFGPNEYVVGAVLAFPEVVQPLYDEINE